MRYNRVFILIPLFFILVFTQSVYAIGVSPSRITLDFEPNLKKTFTFNVINNEAKELKVEFYVKGTLEKYVTLKQSSGTLNPSEIKAFQLEVNLPSSLETPGTHDTRIGVVEAIPTAIGGGTQVGARVGVEMQLWVKVPYPGKYAQVSLEAPNVKVGDTVNFKVAVSNLGTEDFTASDEIDIYASDGTKVATVHTGSTNVKSKESGELFASWSARDVKPGSYRAAAIVKYDGTTANAEKSFTVGGLVVNILDILYDTIKKDSINKFTINVESLWNDKISGVYAELLAFDKNGNQIGKSKSETIEIAANGKASIPIFWDTTGLSEGSYEIKFIINYADRTADKIINVEISTLGIPLSLPSSSLIIIVVIVILIVGVLIYFVKFRPKVSTGAKRKTSITSDISGNCFNSFD